MKSCIEELGRSHFQVFTDFQEVLHGGQGAAGRNGLDVTFVFAEVQAHLIFGYVFFDPQFGNPVTDKSELPKKLTLNKLALIGKAEKSP